MRRITSIFLAGPDRWFPEPEAHLAKCAAMVELAGFKPLIGAGEGMIETEPSEVMARETYARTLETLRGADAVVANLTPWRGAGADQGTAFEVGFAAALGKPIFAFLNIGSEDEADLRGRVEAEYGAAPDEAGVWRDAQDCAIEDYGLPENLMLWAEARRFYVIVTPEPYGDLTGLELCLEAVGLYSE
jgi:nucleoside 2-deoxyribosyltransferase